MVLADTAVSVSLTWKDWVTRYILFPKWAMTLTMRLIPVRRFVDLSFWPARVTRNNKWFGQDYQTANYVKACILQRSSRDYVKIYGALYGFKLKPLERIAIPTLVLNGEHESASVFRHTQYMEENIPGLTFIVIPNADHTSSMENPEKHLTEAQRLLRQPRSFPVPKEPFSLSISLLPFFS